MEIIYNNEKIKVKSFALDVESSEITINDTIKIPTSYVSDIIAAENKGEKYSGVTQLVSDLISHLSYRYSYAHKPQYKNKHNKELYEPLDIKDYFADMARYHYENK